MKVKSKVQQIIRAKRSLWERFLESVKNTPKTFHNKNIHKPNKIDYKAYARFPSTQLPLPEKPDHRSLQKDLTDISSTRIFTKKQLSINSLSTLLYFSLGIRNNSEANSDNLHRFYPSAGGMYPIEAYLIVQSVSGLQKGVYHYYVREHILELLTNELPYNLKEYFSEKFLVKAPVIIVLTSIFIRTMKKYGNRGYNLALLEAGHIGQNIYLNCSDLNLSVCAAGGFYEDALSRLLNIEKKIEIPVYAFALG